MKNFHPWHYFMRKKKLYKKVEKKKRKISDEKMLKPDNMSSG